MGNLACAILGILLAPFILYYPKETTKMRYIFKAYIATALFFGGIYYLIYLKYQKSFAFAEEVREHANIKVSYNDPEVVSYLERIHTLDAFLLIWQQNSNYLNENYAIKSTKTDLIVSRLYIASEEIYTTFVGPNKDVPVYELLFHIKFLRDTLGIQSNKTTSYVISFPQKEEYVMNGGELADYLRNARTRTMNALKTKYNPDSSQLLAFNILDFYYFSFTIIGAADIVATETSIRILIVVQILLILFFAEKKDQQSSIKEPNLDKSTNNTTSL